MTEKQRQFLKLAVIDGKKYEEIEQKLGIDRKTFSPWWNELKIERQRLTIIRNKWKAKCPEIEFEMFDKWFSNIEKKCFYCEIAEDQIKELWLKYPALTKRKRGKSLEIERLEPNKAYSDIENLVLSCYWCNNAKTDTFTKKEFKEMGEVIKRIWQARLEKK